MQGLVRDLNLNIPIKTYKNANNNNIHERLVSCPQWPDGMNVMYSPEWKSWPILGSLFLKWLKLDPKWKECQITMWLNYGKLYLLCIEIVTELMKWTEWSNQLKNVKNLFFFHFFMENNSQWEWGMNYFLVW